MVIFKKCRVRLPRFGGETTIFSLVTVHAGVAKSTGNTGVAEQLGQGPSKLHLNLGAGINHSLLCQGRVGLPGVLRQASRPTGGTSDSQRQQDQLTLEITRWRKANTRMLPTETKVPSEPSSPTIAIPQHTRKARSGFKKSPLMILLEDFKK